MAGQGRRSDQARCAASVDGNRQGRGRGALALHRQGDEAARQGWRRDRHRRGAGRVRTRSERQAARRKRGRRTSRASADSAEARARENSRPRGRRHRGRRDGFEQPGHRRTGGQRRRREGGTGGARDGEKTRRGFVARHGHRYRRRGHDAGCEGRCGEWNRKRLRRCACGDSRATRARASRLTHAAVRLRRSTAHQTAAAAASAIRKSHGTR